MPNKRLGQNFLINNSISKKIVDFAKLNINSNVLEVGSGRQALTKLIKNYNPKSFIVVEYDKTLHSLNEKLFFNTNFKSINSDALKFKEKQYFKNNLTIISNLPYNISSALLIKWIRFQGEYKSINKMILMFQKEMGERIIANKDTKKYGRLSIISKAFFKINKIMNVNKKNFYPIPKVDSVVLEFDPLEKNKIPIKEIHKLEKITNFFFNTRRKRNKKKIEKMFTNKQIEDHNLAKFFDYRPENISEDEYYMMSKII